MKTNVIFFERAGSTSDIYYYELTPPTKLTKNKPITSAHFEEFLTCVKERTLTPNSWLLHVNDIKEFDISAKNPTKKEEIAHKSPLELIESIKENNAEVASLCEEIEAILIANER